MRTVRLSIVGALPILVASLGAGGAGCGHVADKDTAGPPVATALRSQRRLAYMLAAPVAITAEPDRSYAVGLSHELRKNVAQDMRELGLEVDRNPSAGHDLTVRLSVSVQAVGRLSHARAAMYVMAAEGQVLEQIDTAEIIEAPERLGSALARDLVERLARSPRPAEYADAIYGHRLRPLRETVGRHSHGREEPGAGMPPMEALMLTDGRGSYDRTLRGRSELAPPAEPEERDRLAARDDLLHGRALLDAGRVREAYVAFEQAYLLDDNPESLYGLAESLLRAGARHDALVFYRAYLSQAEPGSPLTARAVAQVGAIESPTGAPRAQ